MMAKVLIVLGSKSDSAVGKKAADLLTRFGVSYEMEVASAHRTPERVKKIVDGSDAEVFIAIAGLSAALPGAVASSTVRPVIGVPVSGKLNLDSILSIIQMPPGIPVAAVGLDRGENAALLAVQMLSIKYEELRDRLVSYRNEMAEAIESESREVNDNVQS
jgi:5-(carboxyamino)imidazole ribonucleotide mutase